MEYNYLNAVVADVRAYLEDHDTILTEENFDELHEQMWVCDQVTGNASGSYTFNRWKAEECLAHNWELLQEACEQYGIEFDINKGAEYWDVTIRCYVLDEAMNLLMEKE